MYSAPVGKGMLANQKCNLCNNGKSMVTDLAIGGT